MCICGAGLSPESVPHHVPLVSAACAGRDGQGGGPGAHGNRGAAPSLGLLLALACGMLEGLVGAGRDVRYEGRAAGRGGGRGVVDRDRTWRAGLGGGGRLPHS